MQRVTKVLDCSGLSGSNALVFAKLANRCNFRVSSKMAAGTATVSVSLEGPNGSSATDAFLTAMLRAHAHVSDFIFSPGRVPQLQIHNQLIAIQGPSLRPLTADDTRRIASDLIGNNTQAITALREQGSCDISYSLMGQARFRVNIFIQRGSCAIVMRVIATQIPELGRLGLPVQVQEATRLRDGLVLVTGPRNSGKSSTLAALVDRINTERVCHMITIEDPIEFLHNHKQATVHQRELHSDTPSVALGVRAALRQAPDVIMIGDIRERDTAEAALEAAETGHLVFSGLNTPDGGKALERMLGFFSHQEQPGVRSRLAKALRLIISQRLLLKKDRTARVVVTEIVKVDAEASAAMMQADFSVHRAAEILKPTLRLDEEIAKLIRADAVEFETALAHANNPEQLQNALSRG